MINSVGLLLGFLERFCISPLEHGSRTHIHHMGQFACTGYEFGSIHCKNGIRFVFIGYGVKADLLPCTLGFRTRIAKLRRQSVRSSLVFC